MFEKSINVQFSRNNNIRNDGWVYFTKLKGGAGEMSVVLVKRSGELWEPGLTVQVE